MRNELSSDFLMKRTNERPEDIRGCYYRDETAIIHSRPFRRLKHKTQVFFSPDDDHVCTRIEHVLHVASIAKTICKGLKDKLGEHCELDEDLAYSIGLGHDLGHAPFGHAGEDELSRMLERKFCHEINSYRVVEKIANNGKGLNLTYAVKDGIICHNGEKFEQSIKPNFTIKNLDAIKDRTKYPLTWEGCIVRFSDKIAYLGRDIEDALVAGFIVDSDIPKNIKDKIGSNNSEIINHLILDLVYNSTEIELSFSNECFKLLCDLRDYNYNQIYNHPTIREYKEYCRRIISNVYNYLSDLYSNNMFDIEFYKKSHMNVDKYFGRYLENMNDFYNTEKKENNLNEGDLKKLILSDYISGMTDKFAIDFMKEISIPKPIEFKPY